MNISVWELHVHIMTQFYFRKSRAQCQQDFFCSHRFIKKKKSVHSNLSGLAKDLNCLLSNLLSSECVHALSSISKLFTFLHYNDQLSHKYNTVGWITHVTLLIWKMCACESFHCRDLFTLKMPRKWECESSRQSDGSHIVCAMLLPKHINQSEWVMFFFFFLSHWVVLLCSPQ